jgi:hypothetical protein
MNSSGRNDARLVEPRRYEQAAHFAQGAVQVVEVGPESADDHVDRLRRWTNRPFWKDTATLPALTDAIRLAWRRHCRAVKSAPASNLVGPLALRVLELPAGSRTHPKTRWRNLFRVSIPVPRPRHGLHGVDRGRPSSRSPRPYRAPTTMSAASICRVNVAVSTDCHLRAYAVGAVRLELGDTSLNAVGVRGTGRE